MGMNEKQKGGWELLMREDRPKRVSVSAWTYRVTMLTVFASVTAVLGWFLYTIASVTHG